MFAHLTLPGWFHFLAGLAALVLGLLVFLLPKGTRVHRAAGTAYVAAMLVVCLSAFGIYAINGRPGVFHVLAAVSLTSLTLGMLNLRRWRRTREPARLAAHYQHMAYSYLGLFMAFVSQMLVNPRFVGDWVPGRTAFALALIAINLALYAAGSLLIRRWRRRAMGRYAPA